jgi:hypothetical protein
VESEWGAEVAALRRTLAPRRPVRITYRWKQVASPRQRERRPSAVPEPELWAALFDPAAPEGAPALLELQLEPPDRVDGLRQAEVVEAAGRFEPGGAVAVVLPGGDVVWPTYPATRTFRPPRLEAVDGIVEPLQPVGPPRWWMRTSPRLVVIAVVVVVQVVRWIVTG